MKVNAALMNGMECLISVHCKNVGLILRRQFFLWMFLHTKLTIFFNYGEFGFVFKLMSDVNNCSYSNLKFCIFVSLVIVVEALLCTITLCQIELFTCIFHTSLVKFSLDDTSSSPR